MRHLLLLYILTLVLLIPSVTTYANSEIDSLENLLPKVSVEEKIKILNSLAYKYRVKNPEKTLEYASQALHLAESVKDLLGKHSALSNLGLGYRYLGNYNDALIYQQKALEAAIQLDNEKRMALEYNRIGIIYKQLGICSNALEYYIKALNIREKLNDKRGIANLYNNIGIIYRIRGNLDLALEYYFKTLKIRKELKDKEGYAYILNNIGNLYADLKIYDQALEYHKQSLKVKEELENKYGIGTSYKNIGEIYLQLDKPVKALEYFQQALNIEKEMNDKNGIATSMTGIGKTYIALNKYSIAEEYLTKSLEIIEDIGDKSGIINSYISFSDIYIQLGKYPEALAFLYKSLVLAEEENFLEDISQIYLNYSIIYTKTGQSEKALNYYKKYSAIRDSIFNSEISNKITELQIKQKSEELETEKKLLEEQNKLQQLSNKKKDQLIYSLIAITFLVLILIILVYNRYRNKQTAHKELTEKNKSIIKSEKKLREANATKDKFFSIIAHDLTNPFNAILGFANLLHQEYDYHSDEEKRIMIENLNKAAEGTYKLLQNLLEWSKTQTGNLYIQPEVIDMSIVTNENISIFRSVAQNKKIKLRSHIPFNTLVIFDKNMVNSILRNLISNAIKFTRIEGEVEITSKKNGNFLEVCITDNGIGIKPENICKLFSINEQFQTKGTANENGSGLGLILCKEFVEKNGGKIRAESIFEKESKFIFTLPLADNIKDAV